MVNLRLGAPPENIHPDFSAAFEVPYDKMRPKIIKMLGNVRHRINNSKYISYPSRVTAQQVRDIVTITDLFV